MSDSDEPSRGLRAATWALRAQFFVTGALFATWGVHVPNVKAHYALGEHALALAMMASGVGAVVALLYAGRVLARHSPRRLVPLLGVVSTVAIGSVLLPGRYAWLLVLMLAYGVAGALFDVAVNDEASTIERRAGRPLMSGFHALFSLGGMAGAGAWSLLASVGVSPVEHLAGAAVFLAAVAVGASAFMLRQQRHGAPAGSASLSLPRGPLLLLGLLAAMGLIGEGAMYDWSVLYVRQELAAPSATASLAYASFSGAMAAGRFGGDWVRARMTPVALVRASGALAAIGMALALVVAQPWAAIVSFALVGLGFSNVVPVLFSAAARLPGVAPAHGIAAVSSVGYFGMMVGPPVIGFIAQGSSLTTGLLVVVAFAGVVVAFARRALARSSIGTGSPPSASRITRA